MREKKIHHTYLRRLFLAAYIPLAVNITGIAWGLFKGWWFPGSILGRPVFLVPALAACWLVWMYLNILPAPGRLGKPSSQGSAARQGSPALLPLAEKRWAASLRLTVMEGGRHLCWCALYGFCVQAVVFAAAYPAAARHLETARGISLGAAPYMSTAEGRVFWGSGIYGVVMLFILLWNGILRMFFTSRRLRLSVRLAMLLAMWVPVVNLLVLLYAMGRVHQEYDFECYKESVRLVRAESDLCHTRYPLILVHGVGFRDLRYFNYWGRIPRELTRYGATVYYGNQEAFATVSRNGEDICRKIREVVEETGCGKVNIIAHSKGGLDSRYAVSCLGAAPYVASLTTISTPHGGCRFVDRALKLPEGLYRGVARVFDRIFLRFGDSHPDFYQATRQFSTAASARFNEEVPDAPGVYYQSYATVMRNCLSDPLLTIPYLMIKPLEGENDGLVSTGSARWGDFRGVVRNRRHRGISHGDIIDLKREDYRDFDVVEFYVKLTAELKDRGF